MNLYLNASRVLLCAGLAVSAIAHAAQTYPEKLIKIVVPFPPGGDLEPLARKLCDHFQKAWKQSCIVETKPGAQAMIGTDFVAKSPPDGYTLLICSVGPMTISPTFYAKVITYSVGKDIVPVARIATTPMVLVVGASVPAKTFGEFVAYGKAHPGKLSFASAGLGNVTHLTAELFFEQTGIKAVHVPYKGATAIIADLLGKHIDLYFNPLPSALGYVNNHGDKTKPLAVTSRERVPQLPGVPSFDELGVKGLVVNSWYGLCAPGGTPKAVVEALSSQVAAAVQDEGFSDWLRRAGMNPSFSSSEPFAVDIRTETVQWAKILREKGIEAE